MPTLVERDGHYWHGNEDWGAVVPLGSTLQCCGCRLSRFSADMEICEDCRCHDAARFILRDPLVQSRNDSKT